jgi:hypothetical protein
MLRMQALWDYAFFSSNREPADSEQHVRQDRPKDLNSTHF